MTPVELKRRREALGLSQVGLGARLVSNPASGQVMVARWESGAVPITPVRSAWLEQELARLEQARQS